MNNAKLATSQRLQHGTRFTKAQLLEDIEFLERRALIAGHFLSGDLRDFGASSNQLVHFAYTGEHDGTMPFDMSDLAACVRALASLPDHRRTHRVNMKYEECHKAVRG